MNKRRLLSIATLFLLALLAATAYLFVRTESIARAYKPQLEQILSSAANAPVTLGDIQISIFPNPAFVATDVHVGAMATSITHAHIGKLALRLSLRSLLAGRLVVSHVLLAASSLTLTTAKVKKSALDTPGRSREHATTSPVESPSTAMSVLPFSLAVNEIVVENGSLRLERGLGQDPITVDRIHATSEIEISDATLKAPATTIRARLPSNLEIEAKISDCSAQVKQASIACSQYILSGPLGSFSGSVRVEQRGQHGTIQLSGHDASLEKIVALTSILQPQLSKLRVTGTSNLELDLGLQESALEIKHGSFTLRDLSLLRPGSPELTEGIGTVSVGGGLSDLTLTSSELQLALNGSPLSLSFDLRAQPSRISLASLAVRGFKGAVKFPLTLILDSDQQILNGTLTAKDLELKELLTAFAPGDIAPVRGVVESLRSDIVSMPLANPKMSEVKVSAQVINGALVGCNVANELLTQLAGLPFLSESLRRKVPPEFEDILKKPDTAIARLQLSAHAHNGIVAISEVTASSELFDLAGAGTYGMTGALALDVTITLSQQLSDALITKVPELKVLRGDDLRLTFPVVVKGKLPTLVVVPDIQAIIKSTAGGNLQKVLERGLQGRKGLGKDLRKILGF